MPDQTSGTDAPVQHSYGIGEVLFEEGLQGREMYLIQEGKVGVFKNTPKGKVPLTVVGPGGLLGEQSLFGNHARSATAIAVEPTRALIINQKNLQQVMESTPSWLFTMLKVVLTSLHAARTKVTESALRNPERGIVLLLLLLLQRSKSDTNTRSRVDLAEMLQDAETISRLKEKEVLTMLSRLERRELVKRITSADSPATWIVPSDPEALRLYDEYLLLKARGERFKEADLPEDAVAMLSNIAYVAQKSGQETPDGTTLYRSALVEDLSDHKDPALLDKSLQHLNRLALVVVLSLEEDTLIVFQKERLVRIKKIKEWLPRFERDLEAL